MVLTLAVHTGTKWEVIMFIMVMELKLLTEIIQIINILSLESISNEYEKVILSVSFYGCIHAPAFGSECKVCGD